MTQFDLTDDQLQIQEMARKFTADAITPNAAEWDEKHIFPRDTIREAAELGFGSIYVSEESGGIGLGRLEAALIMEAMAYGCPSTSAFISIHNMASWMIDRFGAAEVKQKYIPSMITMERIGSYCLTEPSSGSDAAALKTKAVLDGDHYVVSGSKAFISGGGENEVYVTMARTGDDGSKGITCLVIDKDMPGVSFGAQEKKLGWHSQPTAQVNFDEVRVPVANRVGGEGEGFRIAMMGLDGGRLNIGACSLGGAQRFSTKRSTIPRAGSSSVIESPIFRQLSSRLPTWRPSFRRRATYSMLQQRRSQPTLRTRPSSRRWPSASRPTPDRPLSTAHCSCMAAMAI